MASIALGDGAKCTPDADYEDLTPAASGAQAAGSVTVYWSDEVGTGQVVASLKRAKEFVLQYLNQDD